MNVPESVIEKIRKVLQLASGGTGGERLAAQKKLNELLNKHGLTINDVNDETIQTYWFPFRTKEEERLIMQIWGRVMQTSKLKGYKRGKSLGFELTKIQAVDMECLFNAHKKEMKKHLEIALTAYFFSNDLAPSGGSVSEKEFSKEERNELERIWAMMETIKPLAIHKQIGKGK